MLTDVKAPVDEISTENMSKKFHDVTCAPKKEDTDQNDFSCYSSKSLEKIKNLWNKRHPDKKITDTDSRSIWGKLKANMNNVCNTEACWLRQNFASSGLDTEIINYTFAPQSPETWKKNPNDWLSSVDIANSMKQYEHAFPSFVFIGPSPVDYDEIVEYGNCVWNELCEFELTRHIKHGKNKIGVIFNTDTHDKPGAHWVSIFIDVRAKIIFFFDSTSDAPQVRIKKFIKMVKDQGTETGIDFKVYINDVPHQKNDTECGVYSLFMIIHMLTGKMTVHDFLDSSKKLSDKYMQRFRRKFFNVDDPVPTKPVPF
jgi:hypothetical protein